MMMCFRMINFCIIGRQVKRLQAQLDKDNQPTASQSELLLLRAQNATLQSLVEERSEELSDLSRVISRSMK